MGLFDAFKKLGSAVVDTALVPLDATADLVTGFEDERTARRLRKLQEELSEAYEETFDDD